MQVVKWSKHKKQSEWVGVNQECSTVICVSSPVIKEMRGRLVEEEKGWSVFGQTRVLKSSFWCSKELPLQYAFASIEDHPLGIIFSLRISPVGQKEVCGPQGILLPLLLWSRTLSFLLQMEKNILQKMVSFSLNLWSIKWQWQIPK